MTSVAWIEPWRSIATVPYKQNVLLSDGRRVTLGWALDQVYEAEGGFDLIGERGTRAHFAATHWMPVPEPPIETKR